MPNHISVTTTFDKNKYELKTTMESGQWHSTLLMDGAELIVIEHKVPIYKPEQKRDNAIAKRIMIEFGTSRHTKYLKVAYDFTDIAKEKMQELDNILAEYAKEQSEKHVDRVAYEAHCIEVAAERQQQAIEEREANKERLHGILCNRSGTHTIEEIKKAKEDLRTLMLPDMWFVHGQNLKTGNMGHLVINKLVVAEYIHRAFNIINYNGHLWRYDWERACYLYDRNDEMIEQEINKIFELVGDDTYHYNGSNTNDKINIMDQAASKDVKTENPFNLVPNVLNTRSGVLKLDYENETVELLGKRPEYMFSYCIDCYYDPSAGPTELEEVLTKILDEDQLEFAYQIPALALRHVDIKLTPAKVAYIFKGGRNTGKSIVHGFFANLLGKSVISRIAFKDIVENKFAKPMLEGKLLNLDDELPESLHTEETRELKNITGNKFHYLEPKNMKPYDGIITAILLFAGNQFPTCDIKKSADAFWERFDIIYFRHTFETNDSFAASVHNRNNMSAFLNKVILKMFELHENSKQDVKRNVSKEEIYDIWQNSSSTLYAFVKDAMIKSLSPVDHNKDKFFKTYSRWCDAKGVPREDSSRVWGIKEMGRELIGRNLAKNAHTGEGAGGRTWQMMYDFKAQWVLPEDKALPKEPTEAQRKAVASALDEFLGTPDEEV